MKVMEDPSLLKKLLWVDKGQVIVGEAFGSHQYKDGVLSDAKDSGRGYMRNDVS